MLQKLCIKNYALIDNLDLYFSKQLTVITGETGAGKSILLGALSLILGNRADTNVLFNKQEKCIVEATFDIQPYDLQAFFAENELDHEQHTTIRREITPAGKTRTFINDTPTDLNTLKKLGEQLVSLHAQHQTLHLYDLNFQLFIVDLLANNQPLLKPYQLLFKQYQKNIQLLETQQLNFQKLQSEMDYIVFQVNELADAQLNNPNEQHELEQQLNQLSNAETIKTTLLQAAYSLNESEVAAILQLNALKKSLYDLAKFSDTYAELAHRIESTVLELRDIYAEIQYAEQDLLLDNEKADEISQRLNVLYKLQKKHHVKTIPELIQIEQNLQSHTNNLQHLEDDIQSLKNEINEQKNELLKQAQQISTQRSTQIPIIENHLNTLLKEVGMPNATVKLKHQILNPNLLTINGLDVIEILFSANKGSNPAELKKVASGGELSRIMLCIQSLIAANTALPTLIFDEIDTGISGEVALKVGTLLQKLGNAHQVISITHLPQIASKGSAHYFVYKENTAERTYTRIKKLEPTERITEIAKMLSGNPPSPNALANAQELLTVFS